MDTWYSLASGSLRSLEEFDLQLATHTNSEVVLKWELPGTPDLASERLRPPAAATSAAVTRGLLVARTAFTTLSLALGGAHKLVFNYFYCLW